MEKEKKNMHLLNYTSQKSLVHENYIFLHICEVKRKISRLISIKTDIYAYLYLDKIQHNCLKVNSIKDLTT